VGLTDQTYHTMTARNLQEMKQALANLQLMAQNVMVATYREIFIMFVMGACPFERRG